MVLSRSDSLHVQENPAQIYFTACLSGLVCCLPWVKERKESMLNTTESYTDCSCMLITTKETNKSKSVNRYLTRSVNGTKAIKSGFYPFNCRVGVFISHVMIYCLSRLIYCNWLMKTYSTTLLWVTKGKKLQHHLCLQFIELLQVPLIHQLIHSYSSVSHCPFPWVKSKDRSVTHEMQKTNQHHYPMLYRTQ